MDIKLTRHWLAFYTKVHQEFKAKELIDVLKIENYLPSIKKLKNGVTEKKKLPQLYLPVTFLFMLIKPSDYKHLNSTQL